MDQNLSSPAVVEVPAPSAKFKLDHVLVVRAEPSITRDANWFWVIAVVSIVNSFQVFAGNQTTFVIGLILATRSSEYVTEISFWDGLAWLLGIIGSMVISGLFARRGHRWAFIVGILVYLLDGVLCYLLEEWIALGFHALPLFFLCRGLRRLFVALRDARSDPLFARRSPAGGA